MMKRNAYVSWKEKRMGDEKKREGLVGWEKVSKH